MNVPHQRSEPMPHAADLIDGIALFTAPATAAVMGGSETVKNPKVITPA